MINIKICKVCKRPHDFEKCPYCKQKELKKEGERDGTKYR